MTGRSVLITGGAGFIGAQLAQRCLADGWGVCVVDNLSTGRRENVPPDARLLELDLSDPASFGRLPEERFAAVFHLAAQSSGEISSEDPRRDFRVNVAGTVELLGWAREHAERFLFASSMAVYGQPSERTVTEETPLVPLSYYGWGKAVAEEYVRRFNRPGFATTSFRFFSVYGPGQNLENMKQGMISIYLAYVLRGEPILVKGSLDRFRDFVYIDDVVEAWMAALNEPRSFGRVYNIGTGRATTVAETLDALVLAFGHDPCAYPRRAGDPTPADQFGLAADAKRAREELGWSPRVDLGEGLSRMADWARGIKP
jgi:UDP-glucose 4-epimerase